MPDRIFVQAYDQLNAEMPIRNYGSNESAKISYGIERTARYREIVEASGSLAFHAADAASDNIVTPAEA